VRGTCPLHEAITEDMLQEIEVDRDFAERHDLEII
jgi:hypothetical protein